MESEKCHQLLAGYYFGIVILLAVLMDVMTKRASANAIKKAMADRTEKASA